MKTYDETVKLLETAIAMRGEDYTYPEEWKSRPYDMCMYVQPDESGPACIVGVAAFKAGVSLERLQSYEGDTADRVAPRLGFDAKATQLLYLVQQLQDEGWAWGKSLEEAIRLIQDEEANADNEV